MATIKDIADAAGVSIGTVDRIIHKRGRYSEETAANVQRIISDLNYSPNIHARGLRKTRTFSFAAVIPRMEQEAGYWKSVVEGIQRASVELSSYCDEVGIYHFDRYSEASCLEVLREALSSGADGLLIAPVLPDSIQQELAETSIPFLFIDTDIPEMTRRISYIGQDSYQSGILSAKLMGLLMARSSISGSPRTALVIEPPGSNYHLQSRIDGFREYMTENEGDVLIEEKKAVSDNEKTFHQSLSQYFSGLQALPDGVFVANSLVYYFASFLRRQGSDFVGIPLIGYDLIPGREDLIEDGTIDFILTQQPDEQGYRGIMMLYNVLVLKRESRRDIIIPLNIITRENLHTFGDYSYIGNGEKT